MSDAGEYLPPLITELKADLSDLAKGFAKAKTLQKDYKASVEGLGESFQETREEAVETGKAITDFERLVGSKMRAGGNVVATLRREYQQLSEQIVSLRKRMSEGGDESLFGDLRSALGDTAKLAELGQEMGITLGDSVGKGFGSVVGASARTAWPP